VLVISVGNQGAKKFKI